MSKKLWVLFAAGAIAAGGITGGLILNEARAGVIEDTIDGMTLEELAGTADDTPSPVEPKLTEQKVRDVVRDLIEPEKWNGHLGIARKHGLRPGQVREINRKRLAKICELTPDEVEPIP